MYSEDDLVLISAIQHFAFCPRQCALIHLEGIWEENYLTAQGKVLHERTHEAGTEYDGDTRVVRGLRLRSLQLGITGVADVVEFHRDPTGIALPSVSGKWKPFPVEYKRGSPKIDDCDRVQLCAQAACLEEMLGIELPEGALFYGEPRRREKVSLDKSLRLLTGQYCEGVHQLIESGTTPPAKFEKRCKACSLLNYCRPKTMGGSKSVNKYIATALSSSSFMEKL